VQIGAELKRGDGSFMVKSLLSRLINSPKADTPTVTRAVEAAMEVKVGLPTDIRFP